ncbi:MAG: hypothetical protein E2O56_07460 [Gammaproteobacteria bacterium]|nr:MAG: hypothetical protein E2O56_07460 [Gammaproteobacteria bacterium]
MTERKNENMERIDKALEGLPRHDAPEHLVQDTLKRVREAQTADHVPNRFRDRNWATGLAAAVVVVAALGIGYKQFGSFDDVMSPESYFEAFEEDKTSSVRLQTLEDSKTMNDRDGTYRFTGGEDREASTKQPQMAQSHETGAGTAGQLNRQLAGDESLFANNELVVTGARLEDDLDAEEGQETGRSSTTHAARRPAHPAAAPTTPPGDQSRRGAEQKKITAGTESGDRYRDLRPELLPDARLPRADEPGKTGFVTTESDLGAAKPKSRSNKTPAGFKKEMEERVATIDDLSKNLAYADKVVNGREPSTGPEAGDKLDAGGLIADGYLRAYVTQGDRLAERFLTELRRLDGLDYQPPTGYWANTYLPGDPVMRRLEAQLRTQYPEALTATFERTVQPFDAPHNAALAVYLHATQIAVDGPSRVQLQVGLKAAERQGGHRPSMNVAVVLDLPETVDTFTAQQLRALLMALNEQRQTGDSFSVTVAGVPGGTVVQANDYRHGTVVSFIEQLANGQLEGDTLNLVDAFDTAVDRLAADDDPNAVLGSSLVVLVTADGIEPETRSSLGVLVHQSAVAGMPVSLVTLAGVNGSDLDAIALAGQGRLRALTVPADAAQLIDHELHSASRTVARAVRLRIQLAPGVRLVDVIGSYRLDEAYAERVREAEKSIDRRLSRNWGIETDRREDEDGIQIVIPGMAAGESHVVLLDVVVDGPGPVADVRVRYKDLVQMSNGVVRASLSLGDADTARHVQGPLERNVLKNLVALETAEAARRAGRYLANGEAAAARAELTNALALIAGLRETVAGWESDAELLADEQRLTRFVSELDAGQYDMLVAALEYAAYRKLLPAALNED